MKQKNFKKGRIGAIDPDDRLWISPSGENASEGIMK
jgi:hypothetical protein